MGYAAARVGQPKVIGELPGHVFQAAAGEEVELTVALNLGTREKIEYLEARRYKIKYLPFDWNLNDAVPAAA